LQEIGYIKEYRWATNMDDMVQWLLSGRGTVVVGTNWYECATPDQRALTADLRWVPVGKLEVGDKLVGFDETASGSARYREATVVQNHRITKPCVEITTSRGVVAVSTNHLFIKTESKRGREWIKAGDLQPGMKLAYMMDPYEADISWEAGWLAGFFDGEGSVGVSSNAVSVAQVIGPTSNYLERVAEKCGVRLGVNYKVPVKDTWQPQNHWTVQGDYSAKLAFLGRIRPQRLLPKAKGLWEGRRVHNKAASAVQVHSVRQIGEQEVCVVGTDTHTLVIEGLLSHNSMFFPDPRTGLVKPSGRLAGGHAYLCVGYTRIKGAFRFINSWGDWGQGGRFWMDGEDLDRLLFAEDGEAAAAQEKKLV
jgi:hypothetical protein